MVKEGRVILYPEKCPECAEREKKSSFDNYGGLGICSKCHFPYVPGKGNFSPRVDDLNCIETKINDLVSKPRKP